MVWGWATWRSRWKFYDVKMKFWPKYKEFNEWQKFFKEKYQKEFFQKAFDQIYYKNLNTWDYQLMAIQFMKESFTITPKYNLIKNIGFGPDSTFSKNSTDKMANLRLKNIYKLIHNYDLSENLNEREIILDYRFRLYKNRVL